MEGSRRKIEAIRVRLRHWFARLSGRAPREPRYRSPREIALQNAADSLGVTLGEDYLADFDLDDVPLDLEALGNPDRTDASREEILAYIQGLSKARRRRRRVIALWLVALVTSVAVVGALIGEVIRVGPLRGDRHFELTKRDRPRLPGGGAGVSKGGNSVSTRMPAVGEGHLLHSAYIDLDDDVCSSTAQVLYGITRTESRGGCISPKGIARAISGGSAFLTGGGAFRDYELVNGYGRSDLKRIVADDRGVRIDSVISSPWYPGRGAPGFAFRTFLVRIWHGPGVRFRVMADMGSSSRNLRLTAVYANGEKAPILSLDEALHGVKPPSRIIDPIREPVKIEDCVVVNPGEKLPPGRMLC